MNAEERRERRRALAACVKMLRDGEQLMYPEIAERLGISRSYASSLYNDPTGEKERIRKNKYRKPCPDCGNLMDGSDGSKGPTYCHKCAPKYQRKWTRETVIQVFQEYEAKTGRVPTTLDAMWKAPSLRARISPARLAELQAVPDDAPRLPSPWLVTELFGSWSDARVAAGFPPSPGGGEVTHRDYQGDEPLLQAIRDGYHTTNLIAAVTGRNRGAVTSRLATLADRGEVIREKSRWGPRANHYRLPT